MNEAQTRPGGVPNGFPIIPPSEVAIKAGWGRIAGSVEQLCYGPDSGSEVPARREDGEPGEEPELQRTNLPEAS